MCEAAQVDVLADEYGKGARRVNAGDKVRSLQYCPAGGYKAGDIFTVTAADDAFIEFVDNDGSGRLRPAYEFELLPAAEETGKPVFKVGDRVRLIKDGLSTTGAVGKLATIKSWYGGKVVDNGQYLLNIDGPVDYETLAVQPQYTRASPECFELLAPSLTIETGKFYRTRDGRKVGPYEHSFSNIWIAGKGNHSTARFPDGRISHHHESPGDLIAEWVDEPASNDNAPLTKPAIVALIENGQPKPSEKPKVHISEESATDEAERLAVKYPGQRFGVFVLADSRIADVVIRRAA
ncbi:hypothetical protein [Brucella anthropi]|uniref:hypothetical protein n=1 Tax=Brucella anthropi TaxID=529 RepID=UPI000F667B20|nr:hypothetical protein [Brucella anthropi]RRY11368.1 hypothetical protein EGJ58_06815 [Brucella anthropi]